MTIEHVFKIALYFFIYTWSSDTLVLALVFFDEAQGFMLGQNVEVVNQSNLLSKRRPLSNLQGSLYGFI